MNNKRVIAILIIVVGAILVGLIIYFTFFYNFGGKQVEKTTQENTPTTTVEVLPPSKLNTNVKANTDENKNNQTNTASVSLPAANAEVVAKNFVERFGSWSNQSNEDYLSGLRLISTKSMQTELEIKAAEIDKNRGDYSKYMGVTSQAVASKTVFIDEKTGKATVDIEVKETSESDGNKQSVVNKKIRLELVKLGKAWKVNAYSWQ